MNTYTNNTKKKYNTSIAPLWQTKSGGFYMGPVTFTKEMIDTMVENVKEGGSLIVKIVAPESRKKPTSPQAYLDVVSPEETAAYVKRTQEYKESKTIEEDVI